MKSFFTVLLLCALALLSGCQGWTRGGAHTSDLGYRVETPSGWIYHPTLGGEFVATRQGLFLQRIHVSQRNLETPLPHSKRTLTATLTPFELAEAIVDEMKADRSFQQLAILENVPTTLGGKPAVRITFEYRVENDARMKSIRYHSLQGKHLYTVGLGAPARHYFDDALPAFETTVRSFVFTESPAE